MGLPPAPLKTDDDSDWLVHPPHTPVLLEPWRATDGSGLTGIVLSNGLISRRFALGPNMWATWDFVSHLEDTGDVSLLRSPAPETKVSLDGTTYAVGVGGLVLKAQNTTAGVTAESGSCLAQHGLARRRSTALPQYEHVCRAMLSQVRDNARLRRFFMRKGALVQPARVRVEDGKGNLGGVFRSLEGSALRRRRRLATHRWRSSTAALQCRPTRMRLRWPSYCAPHEVVRMESWQPRLPSGRVLAAGRIAFDGRLRCTSRSER